VTKRQDTWRFQNSGMLTWCYSDTVWIHFFWTGRWWTLPFFLFGFFGKWRFKKSKWQETSFF
jgi:hypothetical protein